MNPTEQTQNLQAIRIDTDGVAHRVTLTPDPDGSYVRALQEQVGGTFDVVPLSNDLDMWLHEEGIPLGMPVNWVASSLAGWHGRTQQPYFGSVLFTGGADEDGCTCSLSPEVAERVLAFAAGDAAEV